MLQLSWGLENIEGIKGPSEVVSPLERRTHLGLSPSQSLKMTLTVCSYKALNPRVMEFRIVKTRGSKEPGDSRRHLCT